MEGQGRRRGREVEIIGAGISGLLACMLSKGYHPVVFEAESSIGGIWVKTIETTKLQTPKPLYQFSDFPWPPPESPDHVTKIYPTQHQVLHYIQSYARHFNLLSHIRFNTKVVSLTYYHQQPPPEEEEAISEDMQQQKPCWSPLPKGKWNLTLHHQEDPSHHHHVQQVFQADFLIMSNRSSKTATDPKRWASSKFVETYLRHKHRLAKFEMIPKHSFLQEFSSCLISTVPDGFYDKVEQGSIILQEAPSFHFFHKGIVINRETKTTLETDLVILATGFEGAAKLRGLSQSRIFQDLLTESPHKSLPLYRECIHPRIPQLAIIGFSESIANLYTSEIRCRWVAELLDGTFMLPSIQDMEKDIEKWNEYMKLYSRKHYNRSCIGALHIWYNDQLCKDMGWNPRRKKGLIADLFHPYGPMDYTNP